MIEDYDDDVEDEDPLSYSQDDSEFMVTETLLGASYSITSSNPDVQLPSTSRSSNGQPFPEVVTNTLEHFYNNLKMDGWGKKHEENINRAQVATGLTLNQIKVK